jgi:TolB-like protein/DNA-binding winged helix-turn-helix (wHTH) protein
LPQERIRIGDWLLEPGLNRLSRDGQTIPLEPLAAEVLAFLARHAGEVVSADALTEALWPRRFVGDSPVYRIIAELRRALGDDARKPEYIETIRKRGYRLVASVSRLDEATMPGEADEPGQSDEPATGAAHAAPPLRAPLFRRSRPGSATAVPVLIAAGLLTIVGAALLWSPAWHGDGQAATVAAIPGSVAVLPFADLSSGSDHEHIADGIAETLIHQLAQLPDLHVIARNSSFTFKGTNTDVREVGRILSVETVLEGSVQRADGKLRVTAQLVDARTGTHVWSRRFDRGEADIFAVQDEIALAVLEEIADSSVTPATYRRSSDATDNLGAYDYYLLGRARLASRATEEAARFFEAALEFDPRFALAHTGLAEALLYDAGPVYRGYPPDMDALTRAREAIETALALDPEQVEAHASRILLASLDRDWEEADRAYADAVQRGPSHMLTPFYYAHSLQARTFDDFDRTALERAERQFRRAAALDPASPLVASSLARLYRLMGRRDDAMVKAEATYALALTPDDVLLALDTLGFVSFETGRLDRAVAYTEIAGQVRRGRTPEELHRLGESYAHLGDFEEATRWFARVTDDRDSDYLFNLGFLALFTGDTGRFNAIVDEILNDQPTELGEFYPYDAIMLLASAARCDEAVDIGSRIPYSPMRELQPAADIYLAYCHRALGSDEAAEFEANLRRYSEWVNETGFGSRIDYLLATSIATVLGDEKTALERLEQTYEAGFRETAFIETDIFEPLRDNERYRRVLAAMRDDNAAMRARLAEADRSGDWFSLAGIEPKSWMAPAGRSGTSRY